MSKVWTLLALALLTVVPAGSADDLQQEVVSRECMASALGQDLRATCEFSLEHVVSVDTCTLTECTITHSCTASIYGHYTSASFTCGDDAGTLGTTGLDELDTYAVVDTQFVAPVGTCHSFTVSGSARAPAMLGGRAPSTGTFGHTITVCA